MKLENLAKAYNYRCYWCRKKFDLIDLSRDHIIPVRKSHRGGGKGGFDKVVLACKCCNLSRDTRPFFSYSIKVRGK